MGCRLKVSAFCCFVLELGVYSQVFRSRVEGDFYGLILGSIKVQDLNFRSWGQGSQVYAFFIYFEGERFRLLCKLYYSVWGILRCEGHLFGN
jgi:hypothetical protein